MIEKGNMYQTDGMREMRKKRKRKYILAGGVILLVLFLVARYGWRIRGLRACNSVYETNVTVSDSSVVLEGYTVCPFCRFIGHTYRVEGDKMYVGVKAREFLGVLPTDKGSFYIEIPTEEVINEVYWCTGNNERLEWSRRRFDQSIREIKLKVETSSEGGKEYIRASVFMPLDPKLMD